MRTFWPCLNAEQSIENIMMQVTVLDKGAVAAAALKNTLNKQTGSCHSEEMNGIYPRRCEGDIEVTDLSFAYSSQPVRLSLNSASFFFPSGETTFVSKSGSGKSTLGQLLSRVYSPTSGEILIDGMPIEGLSKNWIRNNVTLVEQRSILFNESIFMNIAVGRREYDQIRKEDVQESIDLAMLQSVIDHMPKGIDTRVGYCGNLLSGGQRQRVAISRARLSDTPILILDEPTSALDGSNRNDVIRAIREWRKGKTTIIITHDMSHILDNDFAYILDQGSVIQAGYRFELERIPANEKFFRTDGGSDLWDDSDAEDEYVHIRPHLPYLRHPYSMLSDTTLGTFFDLDAGAVKWTLIVLGVLISDGVVSFFMHYLLSMCGQAWVDRLRKRAFRRVLDQPRQWFEEDVNIPSQLTTCLARDGEEIRDILGRFGGYALVAASIAVIATVWSMAVCWKLTLVAISCGPVIYAIARGFDGTTGLWDRRCSEARSAASEVFVETFSEIHTVRALTLEPFFHGKHMKAVSKCLITGLRRAFYTGFLFGLLESTIIFVSASIFYYGGLLLSIPEFTVEEIMTKENPPFRAPDNVKDAAKAAGINDYISSLLEGYSTVIGDGGVGLSGGQAQRLVIARALVRRPHILILDEATSSLDPASAEIIRDTVRELVTSQRGLTMIIITHAREMMEIADNVVVLHQGYVVESGSYRTLAKRPGGHLKTLVDNTKK
ncbi:hypothetical protein BBP40_008128 [Aspergillus hancockii]|nr:hypothetical protein BBP40_008128 [Aspergillus hancockii]